MAKTYPASAGMRMVLDMIKAKHLADLVDSNQNYAKVWISLGANHGIYNGKPYYYPEQKVLDLQRVITQTAEGLMNTFLTDSEQTMDEFPYCYGEDFVSKFKVLGKVIKLPYLFYNVLGKTEGWMKLRLSSKWEVKYYNKFTEDELKQINDGIHEIAHMLMDITLEYEKPEPTQQSGMTDEESLQAWEEEMAMT